MDSIVETDLSFLTKTNKQQEQQTIAKEDNKEMIEEVLEDISEHQN